MSYNSFANVYDILMRDADYKKRTAYFTKLFRKHGETPSLLLDLACGTGEFSNRFAKLGIEVIGVDMSEDMLSVAREKSSEACTDILYLCQKAEELDLYGTVDGAICCMDSINHITDIKKLSAAIKKVSLFLEKDGLFIFDVNTKYKHSTVLANNTFAFEESGVYCVWQNRYNAKKLTTEISLDFFIKNGESYSRSSERFKERAYTPEQLEKVITDAGLSIEAVYDDLSLDAPHSSSERIIYVTKKSGVIA